MSAHRRQSGPPHLTRVEGHCLQAGELAAAKGRLELESLDAAPHGGVQRAREVRSGGELSGERLNVKRAEVWRAFHLCAQDGV